MPSIFEQVLWVLKKAGRSAKKNTKYYIAHPSEAWEDLVAYAKENPKEFALTCALIVGGVLVIVLPLVIGFGPAGPILGSIAAGWQSGIGAVAAGSLFAVLQSMAMTGAFTGIGVGLIALGVQTPLTSRLLQSPFRMIRGLDNSQTPWYLHRDHTNPHGPSPRNPDPDSSAEEATEPLLLPDSGTEEITKRIFFTNSRAAHAMVWKSLDTSNNSATIKEHAWDGFDVRIYLIEGPRTEPGDTGFYERFEDHETGCNPTCQCTGKIEDVDIDLP